MSEPAAPPVAQTVTSGTLLRQARTAHGLHIAALAATVKVPQRKLEALESDRLDELPDAAFARALAKKVCHVLKIDAEPILALMPQPPAPRLEHASRGLDQPFRPDGLAEPPTDVVSWLQQPVVWGPALILLAALGLLLVPPGFWRGASSLVPQETVLAPPAIVPAPAADQPPASAPAVAAVEAAASAQSESNSTPPAVQTVHSVPAEGIAAAEAVTGLLVVRTSAESWIEVLDASDQALLSRTVQPGETVGLDGKPPFRVRVGNVAGTQLVFRGEPVDLGAAARSNVARLELK
ncbi:MAG: helix-turn-helix domain-containing protein [Burkholderiales bacterium]|nr:MAG: helix-turn-helix domain-containing protein [Burkholderiales bacterium]